ncbi:MAG: cytochrome P450 [bacterium]|nr:cytochrome P450 [Gammaproteobacteria bacterium]HIL95493.1 cytochrome P450 [Pseudomonadales bacterium]
MSESADMVARVLDPYSIPLDGKFDVSDAYLFQQDLHWAWFERLRNEAPVHYCEESEFGPYWSVTKYNDIMQVDTSPEIYSSEGGITIVDEDEEFPLPMFIAMDPPVHDVQRKTVSPVVAPMNLAKMEGLIRQRVCTILDSLPIGEEFDWVDKVSIELTTQMLATLFDFPFEDRHKLTRWSDVATTDEDSDLVESEDQRREELMECLEYFTKLWQERAGKSGNDLISMLANGESTKDMLDRPAEYLGNLVLLIVGGNDTTRNSLTGGVLALNQFPAEYDKLRANPKLIPSMVPEIIRWQTPLAHMRRRATQDTILNGQKIKQGDKVVMWYVSGNRDEDVIDRPNDFIIDRAKPRQHLSFGFGIHRCMGNRLAEMQLRIAWEEILERFESVEVVGEPTRILSGFVKGYSDLPVKLTRKG